MSTFSKGRTPFERIEDNAYATPDFVELRASGKKLFPVLVYDDQQSFGKWNAWMEDAVYFGKATTVSSNLIMKLPEFVDSKGNLRHADFPLAVEMMGGRYRGDTLTPAQHSALAKIKGEVWGLPLRGLANMDMYCQNGSGTQRVLRWVTMLEQHIPYLKPSQKVYMYILDEDFWESTPKSKKVLDFTTFPMTGHGTFDKWYHFTGQMPDTRRKTISH